MGLNFWSRDSRREQERAEQLAIGKAVLEEAFRKAKAQVDVPTEVEQSFAARYWDKLNKLFKL